MTDKSDGLLDRLAARRVQTRWQHARGDVQACGLQKLTQLRKQARSLRDDLNGFIHAAEARLDRPAGGAASLPLLTGTDWSWRPAIWQAQLAGADHVGAENRSALGPGVTLFHDCRNPEVITRQIVNRRKEDRAPFGLQLDVFHFDGSFMSLAVDLPPEAIQGLKTRHLVRMDAIFDFDRPLEIFARLNVKHGPNVEQIVREIPLSTREAVVEFDLFYTELNEKRVEQAWMDLIFERPAQNQVILRDLALSRRPRAEL